MNAIDTNVFIYCHDQRDPVRQEIASRVVVEARPWALVWQVGCEFIAASRKLESVGFRREEAWAALHDMRAAALKLLLPKPELWDVARNLQLVHTLSFWDAMLVAACLREDVQTLFTEDMGAPRVIEGLSLVNPFVTPP